MLIITTLYVLRTCWSDGYYGWRGRVPSARERANTRFPADIRRVHAASDGVLGAPRIW